MSGFFLIQSLESLKDIRVLHIYWNKIKGVWKPYFVALILLSTYMILMSYVPIKNWKEIILQFIGELLMVQEWGIPIWKPYYNGPTWYISAMMLATLILTICYKVIPRRYWIRGLVWGCISTYSVIGVIIRSLHIHGTVHGIPLGVCRALAGMGIGGLVYLLSKKRKVRNRNYMIVGILTGSILSLLSCMRIKDNMWDYGIVFTGGVLIWSITDIRSSNEKINVFCYYLGKLSYIIYLNHSLVRYVLDDFCGRYTCWNYIIITMLFACAMLLVAEKCNYFFDIIKYNNSSR